MKQIVYLITFNGVDGRDKESIDFASLDEPLRDEALRMKGKNKCYYSSVDRIIDTALQYNQSLAKLNALDKLVLSIV